MASFYPLAFAAEQIGGPSWRVIDLTPPGAEAHDVELTLNHRAQIEEAALVLYLGELGFQPQIEAAVADAEGIVSAADSAVTFLSGDPHVWLLPSGYIELVQTVAAGFARADPERTDAYELRAERLVATIRNRQVAYDEGLGDCRYGTVIVPHAAFGYVTRAYGLEQWALTGPEPEADATLERLAQAETLLANGRAGSVFFEAGGETERIARTLAEDHGAPSLPLWTMESRPPIDDFVGGLDRNLDSLMNGLDCF